MAIKSIIRAKGGTREREVQTSEPICPAWARSSVLPEVDQVYFARAAHVAAAFSLTSPHDVGTLAVSSRVPAVACKVISSSMKRYCCGLVALGLFVGVTGQTNADYVYKILDVPFGIDTAAFGINDAGQIAGTYVNKFRSFTQFNGFRLDGSRYSMLPNLSGDAVVHTWAFGVNGSGQVVGYYETGGPPIHPDGPFHGYLLSQGVYTTLDVPNATSTQAFGINASRQLVGSYNSDRQHGFLLSGGAYTTLDVPGSKSTGASGINSSGQIVGTYADSGGKEHGFLYSDGRYTTVDVPSPFGGLSYSTNLHGINDSGQMVGEYEDEHGFVLSNGKYTNLDVPGSIYTEADAINNSGQIVGYFYDNFGNAHGFLATLAPVPEPSSLVLLWIGTLGLIWWVRWRKAPERRALS